MPEVITMQLKCPKIWNSREKMIAVKLEINRSDFRALLGEGKFKNIAISDYLKMSIQFIE